jgi:hypothetical protein
MRELTSHRVNGCNEALEIYAVDEPGYGGASHHYQIVNVARQNAAPDGDYVEADFSFQNGPIKEVGTNGITHEALLAILIDRLEGFQSGKYACEDNREALVALQVAQMCLQRRTRARLDRGVEGTHAV